jgi:hypothetical protein
MRVERADQNWRLNPVLARKRREVDGKKQNGDQHHHQSDLDFDHIKSLSL